MTEKNSEQQYIKCARCYKKYINKDDNIKNDFGYNRLSERYKTCVGCRSKKTCDKCGLEVSPNNLGKHKKTKSCEQWRLIQTRIDIHDPEIIRFTCNANDDPIPVYKDYEKTIEYKEKYLGYDRNQKQLSVEEQIKLLDIC